LVWGIIFLVFLIAVPALVVGALAFTRLPSDCTGHSTFPSPQTCWLLIAHSIAIVGVARTVLLCPPLRAHSHSATCCPHVGLFPPLTVAHVRALFRFRSPGCAVPSMTVANATNASSVTSSHAACPHWGYSDTTKWGDLCKAYELCSAGIHLYSTRARALSLALSLALHVTLCARARILSKESPHKAPTPSLGSPHKAPTPSPKRRSPISSLQKRRHAARSWEEEEWEEEEQEISKDIMACRLPPSFPTC